MQARARQQGRDNDHKQFMLHHVRPQPGLSQFVQRRRQRDNQRYIAADECGDIEDARAVFFILRNAAA